MNWQPIQTAPMDGSPIDLYVKGSNGNGRYTDRFYHKIRKKWCYYDISTDQIIEQPGKELERDGDNEIL